MEHQPAAPGVLAKLAAERSPSISAEVVSVEVVDARSDGSSKSLFNSASFARFTIKVSSSADGYNSYRVKRRYRQFDALHASLRAAYRGLPELPAKVSGKDEESRAAARKEGLTAYLRTILADPLVSKSDDLAAFLELTSSHELFAKLHEKDTLHQLTLGHYTEEVEKLRQQLAAANADRATARAGLASKEEDLAEVAASRDAMASKLSLVEGAMRAADADAAAARKQAADLAAEQQAAVTMQRLAEEEKRSLQEMCEESEKVAECAAAEAATARSCLASAMHRAEEAEKRAAVAERDLEMAKKELSAAVADAGQARAEAAAASVAADGAAAAIAEANAAAVIAKAAAAAELAAAQAALKAADEQIAHTEASVIRLTAELCALQKSKAEEAVAAETRGSTDSECGQMTQGVASIEAERDRWRALHAAATDELQAARQERREAELRGAEAAEALQRAEERLEGMERLEAAKAKQHAFGAEAVQWKELAEASQLKLQAAEKEWAASELRMASEAEHLRTALATAHEEVGRLRSPQQQRQQRCDPKDGADIYGAVAYSFANPEACSGGTEAHAIESPHVGGFPAGAHALTSPNARTTGAALEARLLPSPAEALDCLSVSIPSCARSAGDAVGGFWSFSVHVTCAGVHYVVLKRYSDFVLVHKRLLASGLAARLGASAAFPPLPPKRSWRAQHEAFAEVRRLELQRYLQLLVLEPEIRGTTEIHAFLELGLLLRREVEDVGRATEFGSGGAASSIGWGSPASRATIS